MGFDNKKKNNKIQKAYTCFINFSKYHKSQSACLRQNKITHVKVLYNLQSTVQV